MANPVGGWNWSDQMKGLIAACNEACPKPELPNIATLVQFTPVTTDTVSGIVEGGDSMYVADPSNPQLSDDYIAELQGWQLRWRQMYRDLYPKYMSGVPAPAEQGKR